MTPFQNSVESRWKKKSLLFKCCSDGKFCQFLEFVHNSFLVCVKLSSERGTSGGWQLAACLIRDPRVGGAQLFWGNNDTRFCLKKIFMGVLRKH